MTELVNDPDGTYIPPQVENVGEAFVDWAEKYWALNKLFENSDKDKGPNEESAPWNHIREIFIQKINELSENKKPDSYPPGYYKFSIVEKPV